MDSESQLRNAVDIKIHPSYDRERLINNICLISIEHPFEFNSYISSIRLPLQTDIWDNIEENVGVVSGWGRSSTHQNYPHDSLQFTMMTVTTRETCVIHTDTNEGSLCAETNNGKKYVCDADSGSPFVINFRLLGIVSIDFDKECKDQPLNTFTFVTHYLDWIKRTTGIPVST